MYARALKSSNTSCLLNHEYFYYRIDGLKSGPIYLGDVTNNDDWWGIAKPAIEEVVFFVQVTDFLKTTYT